MDKQLLRVLIVDESPDDTEQATDVLRKAGFILKTQRCQDAASLHAELARGQWDFVISEFQLSQLKGTQVLDAVRRTGQDLPLVILTRRISDDEIAKIMRSGAADVIIKDQTARLAPVVERELTARKTRSALETTQENLLELEAKHRALVGASREAICYSHDGMHLDANRAYLTLFGYEELGELEGVPFLNLVDRPDHKQIRECFRKAGSAGGEPLTFTAINRQGQPFPAEISVSTITIKGEACQQIVVSDISKRRAAEQKLQYLSQRDGLTGLYNRHYFLQQLNKVVKQAQTENTSAVLVRIDIEQMSKVNHELGLEAGDRLLLLLAKVLRSKLRDEDVVARLSGDTFATLMPGHTQSSAQAIVEGLHKSLAGAIAEEVGKTCPCSCSLTMTAIGARTASVQQVLKEIAQMEATPGRSIDAPETRRAHAESSADARASVASAASAARPAALQPPDWAKRIASALAEGRIGLVFQPIVNLHADPAECYEVLVRLSEEDGKEISAGEFMAAAEESGQAQQIDRFVLQQVLEKLAVLQQHGKKIRFFINVSLCALRDAGFLAFLEERLRTTHVNGRYLVFEIDDAAVQKLPNEAGRFIITANQLGCRLAIDDFKPARGPYVQQHPITYLKISGATVLALGSDSSAEAAVRAISGMAKALGKRVVAKSVESAESLSALWRYEIDYVQGHYFQMPAAQLGYDFNMESISSDEVVSAWVPTQ